MISIEEALSLLAAKAKPLKDTETVPLMKARHRILASSQQALIDVPNADASAMDGYALRADDLKNQSELSVSQRIPAGQIAQKLIANTAARIFTGSEIPAGADTVVIQENCITNGDKVKVIEPAKKGANIRRRGQDIKKMSSLFSSGHFLLPQDLGLLASVGIEKIPVFRKIKVAIFSTGDELVEPGKPLNPGKIYNSNRFTLTGLLESIDAEVIDCGNVRDTLQDTVSALREASQQADIVMTTGGVSVGEEDHVKAAVEQLEIGRASCRERV